MRQPIIADEFSPLLHKAMVSKAVELGSIVHAGGGIEDHVHLVVSVPPKIGLFEFVRQIKGNSSHFVNHVIKPEYLINSGTYCLPRLMIFSLSDHIAIPG